MLEVCSFLFGTVVGSFLNVCIYRIPCKKSIISPASHCPHCEMKIPFYYNIPIISYLWLKGKCFSCRSKISFRYPVVEILSGLLTLLTFLQFGLGKQFFFYVVFIYFLIVISFIDIDTKLILNKLLIYLLIFGFAANLFLNVIQWQEALLGIVAGGLLMIMIALLGQLLFRKESLGMGDVKLAAVAGFFLGWKMIIVAVFCGFALSLPVLIALMVKGRIKLGDYIPLGPFIAFAFAVFVFWGNLIINWYLNLFITSGL